jgi:hypothetical protein
MELPSLAAVLAWVGALLADCLRAWCKKRILRATGIEPPAATEPTEPTELLPAPAPNDLIPNNCASAEPDSLARLLQETVARFRRGDHP